MKSSLHPALHRAQVRLDKLPPGAVVLDDFDHAWQFGGTYWYCAYRASFVSSRELVQIARGKLTVIHPLEATPEQHLRALADQLGINLT